MIKKLGIFLSLLFIASTLHADPLTVVTTTADLADLVRNIGGNNAQVTSLSTGKQDIHFIEPRPSMVMKLRSADLVVVQGMEVDKWMNGLLEVARKRKINIGAQGYLDASLTIPKLEIPTGKIDGSMGDIHPDGNPHYMQNPENAKRVAKAILKKLIAIAPDKATEFNQSYDTYIEKLTAASKKWHEMLKPFEGTKIITYHPTWLYFADAFGLNIIGTLEPKPGIPPTPGHLAELLKIVAQQKAKLILVEPFYNVDVARKLGEQAGIPVIVLPSSVDGSENSSTYIETIGNVVSQITSVLKRR